MISKRWLIMDNLLDVYYLVQLIVQQILIFLRGFIFREFTWFAPAEENLDNAGSKIRAVAPQHPAADLLVLLVICGLLFAFMILSANSPKSEGSSSYDRSNIETISMALEEDPSSFWYSRTAGLTSCFHACDDSIDSSRDFVPKMRNTSHPAISKTMVSQRKGVYRKERAVNIKSSITVPFEKRRQTKIISRSCHESRITNYNESSSHIKHSQKTQAGRPVSQTTPPKWLIRSTRSGHVYGKYPI